MLRLTGRPAESSTVVHNSLAYAYTPMPREEALARLSALGYSGVQPFFLHVGSDAWYKNRLGLLRIFDRLHKRRGCTDARLLLIGSALDDKLNRYIRRKGLENRVTRLSGLSNEDLRAAYSLAQALIFPSLTEGFGWPVLEAQACGCPVFATGREPMTEVGGTAAVYFDPEEPAAAAAMIVAKLPQRGEMAAAGFENLQGFSVGQMIDGYERAYRHVLGQV
jgi:glycosyltransferase involved in cell wall biosynthesis